jgi:hypothetical protein
VVVHKQLAIEKFNKEVEKAVLIAIPAIDRILNDHIDGDVTTIFINNLKLPQVNNKVFEETIDRISKKYEKNGWTVSFEAGATRDKGALHFV